MATFKMLLVAFSVFFLGIFAQEWLPKKGKCPILKIPDECSPFKDIENSCLLDADCSGDQKCCTDGCHLFCVAPRKQAVTKKWLPKKGKCPILETSDECSPRSDLQSSCLFDGDCSGDQKCCTDGCHLFCVAPRKQAVTKKPPPKKARCPVVKATQDCLPNRNKKSGCLVDSDCPRGKACCSDGCGLYCVTVKPVKKHVAKPWRSPFQKNGRCPNIEGPLSDCPAFKQTSCLLDLDCHGDQKCCSDGCHFVCAKPAKEYVTKADASS